MIIIAEILLMLLALDLAGGIIFLAFGHLKCIYHDFMGWHQPDQNAEIWNDGCSNRCKCKYCEKEIMQDSQGNWFTID